MTARLRFTAVVLIMAAGAFAQEYYPHHNFTFGGGAGLPRGDLDQFLQDSSGVSIGYGYRFHRYFQADIGLDILFGAARIRDFLETGIGTLRIKDREYFVPFGGRAIAPLIGGRLLISGGMGGAYMRYGERVSQPSSFFRVDCPVCTSRSGWGYYGLFNVSVFLDSNRNFRVGATSRVYRGHTEGDPLGAVPAIRTVDRWVKIFGEVGFSF